MYHSLLIVHVFIRTENLYNLLLLPYIYYVQYPTQISKWNKSLLAILLLHIIQQNTMHLYRYGHRH